MTTFCICCKEQKRDCEQMADIGWICESCIVSLKRPDQPVRIIPKREVGRG